MTVDSIIMAVLVYGFYVGGFVFGLVKTIRSDRKGSDSAEQ